ncbi:MAG: hypothetical protein FWG32_09340 [Oscillospiraceae bacterium]|nr:hypothetical protein [Oscillospiraceae bacterium]
MKQLVKKHYIEFSVLFLAVVVFATYASVSRSLYTDVLFSSTVTDCSVDYRSDGNYLWGGNILHIDSEVIIRGWFYIDYDCADAIRTYGDMLTKLPLSSNLKPAGDGEWPVYAVIYDYEEDEYVEYGVQIAKLISEGGSLYILFEGVFWEDDDYINSDYVYRASFEVDCEFNKDLINKNGSYNIWFIDPGFELDVAVTGLASSSSWTALTKESSYAFEYDVIRWKLTYAPENGAVEFPLVIYDTLTDNNEYHDYLYKRYDYWVVTYEADDGAGPRSLDIGWGYPTWFSFSGKSFSFNLTEDFFESYFSAYVPGNDIIWISLSYITVLNTEKLAEAAENGTAKITVRNESAIKAGGPVDPAIEWAADKATVTIGVDPEAMLKKEGEYVKASGTKPATILWTVYFNPDNYPTYGLDVVLSDIIEKGQKLESDTFPGGFKIIHPADAVFDDYFTLESPPYDGVTNNLEDDLVLKFRFSPSEFKKDFGDETVIFTFSTIPESVIPTVTYNNTVDVAMETGTGTTTPTPPTPEASFEKNPGRIKINIPDEASATGKVEITPSPRPYIPGGDDDVEPSPEPSPDPSPEPSPDPSDDDDDDDDDVTPPPPPPPPPPGDNLVPGDDPFTWIELDENGVPLTIWRWDPDLEEWIPEDITPLASALPPTGDKGIWPFIAVFLFSLTGVCATVLCRRNNRKFTE